MNCKEIIQKVTNFPTEIDNPDNVKRGEKVSYEY